MNRNKVATQVDAIELRRTSDVLRACAGEESAADAVAGPASVLRAVQNVDRLSARARNVDPIRIGNPGNWEIATEQIETQSEFRLETPRDAILGCCSGTGTGRP